MKKINLNLPHHDRDQMLAEFAEQLKEFLETYQIGEIEITDHPEHLDYEDEGEVAQITLLKWGEDSNTPVISFHFMIDEAMNADSGEIVSWSVAAQLIVQAAGSLGRDLLHRAEQVRKGLAEMPQVPELV